MVKTRESLGADFALTSGKMDRVVLTQLEFTREFDGDMAGSVEGSYDYVTGLKKDRDGYFVKVDLVLKGIPKNKKKESYRLEVTMVGVYSLPGKFDGTDDQLGELAVHRGSLQIISLMRSVVKNVLECGGITITNDKIPFEPAFPLVAKEGDQAKVEGRKVKSKSTKRRKNKARAG